MRIPELFGPGAPVFSFEFFLPKTPEDTATLFGSISELKRLGPAFVTLTYGAAGTARERTVETAGRVKSELGVETACHLTCITHTRSEIADLLRRIRGLGIESVVALRGDPPKDAQAPPPGRRDFGYARDLVGFIRERADFSIGVAGYPEKHPEAPSIEEDVRRLAEKVAAGGDWVITQLFFDNRDYFEFVKEARAAGIRVPIVPGIMPVTGYGQLKRFTNLCGATIPFRMAADLELIKDDPEAVVRYGIEHGAKQCRELLDKGAPGIHFYTLNKSRSTREILRNLRGS
ncbi:MAG: methylenetetrahydrofolate reductase [NAD(P)H] [Elusimicrobia bacterium]|nr:methylenetetrahydrofolate reductase [NAD(P)H] [Elusimicrobiota bacterium]